MPFYTVLGHIVVLCEAILPHGASRCPFQRPQGHITARRKFRVAKRDKFRNSSKYVSLLSTIHMDSNDLEK